MRDEGLSSDTDLWLASSSRTVDSILAALQQPTLASDPEVHTYNNKREVPVMWSVSSDINNVLQKYSAQGKLLDRDGSNENVDTVDVSVSTVPSVLTLMRMMSERIAAQREAIAELKAKE